MPKVTVLFFGDERATAVLDAVVAGAKSVRFTEVEVRAATGSGTPAKYKRIDPAHPWGEADGVVFVADGASDSGQDLAPVIDRLAQAPAVCDLVLGVAADAPVVDRVARTGGIIIANRSSEAGPDSLDEARALGVRVAKVAAWVRHGLGHEAEHEHGHHDHGHHDHHHHDHADHQHHDHHH